MGIKALFSVDISVTLTLRTVGGEKYCTTLLNVVILPPWENVTASGTVPGSNAAGNTRDTLTDEIVKRLTEAI